MQQIITRLQEEKRKIEENPELPITNKIKSLRQRFFKANYNKRKTINLELSLAAAIPQNVKPLNIIYPNNYSCDEDIDFSNDSDYEDQQ